MLFKRRHPLTFSKRVISMVWPRAGWRRAATYMGHRLSRLPGSPSGIAAGFACGAAISFTPLIGLHFVGAAGLAWIMRGNIFASAVGTVVGNPWTFPFIWAWIFSLGRWILGWEVGRELPDSVSISFIVEHPWDIFLPMLIGAIPTAIVAWFVFYFPVLRLVTSYQRARGRRLQRKAVREAIRSEHRREQDSGMGQKEKQG